MFTFLDDAWRGKQYTEPAPANGGVGEAPASVLDVELSGSPAGAIISGFGCVVWNCWNRSRL